MKIVLSTVLAAGFLLTSFYGHAQIKKGETMLGGTISFKNVTQSYDGTSTITKYKVKQLTFSPQFGIGLGKNWIVGILGGYAKEKHTDNMTSSNNYDGNIYTIGVFGRKFFTLGDKFGIFGQVNVEPGWGDQTVFNSKQKIKVLSAGGQPGFYFTPGKKIILEMAFGMIGYSSSKITYENQINKSKDEEFDFSITDGASIGIKFVL